MKIYKLANQNVKAAPKSLWDGRAAAMAVVQRRLAPKGIFAKKRRSRIFKGY